MHLGLADMQAAAYETITLREQVILDLANGCCAYVRLRVCVCVRAPAGLLSRPIDIKEK